MTDSPSGSSPSPRLIPPPRASEGAASGRPFESKTASGLGPLTWILVAGGLAGVVFAVVVLPRFVVRPGSQPAPTATTPASPDTRETAEARATELPATAATSPSARSPEPEASEADRPSPQRSAPAALEPTTPEPSASGSSESGRDPTRPQGPPPDFAAAMSEGHAALERSAFDEARQAFLRAAALVPGSTQASEGLARTDEGRRATVLMEQLSKAKSLEEQEDWAAAAAAYLAALATDGTVIAAQEGRARTGTRAELAGRLSFHTRNRERLGAASVFEEAEKLLAQAREVSPRGRNIARSSQDSKARSSQHELQ